MAKWRIGDISAMLTHYGKREWLTILAIGVMLSVTLGVVGIGWAAIVVAAMTVALLSFFRDPDRRIPTQRGIVVSPSDGRISSVHKVDFFEPLGEPAVCIRIFMSVLDVHVNRSPCHSRVKSIHYKPGRHLNALNPESAECNESNTIVFTHPTHGMVIAAMRQVAGMLARTIVCQAVENQILQRGQRLGMIKLGSTTELYLPQSVSPEVAVQQGQYVKGGLTIMAKVDAPVTAPGTSSSPAIGPVPSQAPDDTDPEKRVSTADAPGQTAEDYASAR